MSEWKIGAKELFDAEMVKRSALIKEEILQECLPQESRKSAEDEGADIASLWVALSGLDELTDPLAALERADGYTASNGDPLYYLECGTWIAWLQVNLEKLSILVIMAEPTTGE